MATSLFATGVHTKNDNIYSMIATSAVVIGISQFAYAGLTTLQYTYANSLESYRRSVSHFLPARFCGNKRAVAADQQFCTESLARSRRERRIDKLH